MQPGNTNCNSSTFYIYATTTSTSSFPYSYFLDNLLNISSSIADSNASSIAKSYVEAIGLTTQC